MLSIIILSHHEFGRNYGNFDDFIWDCMALIAGFFFIYAVCGERIFRRDVCLIWILLFAFAPIILLGLLLYFPVSYICGSNGECEALKKEKKERAREREQAMKEHAVENFAKCHDSLVNAAVIEQIGRKLLNINFDTRRFPEELQMMMDVDERIPSYGEIILGVLDKIKLSEGYSLELEFPDCSGCGGRTYINVKEPNGSLSKNFLDFVIVDDSPLGALQVYFLNKLWHHLPMYWHGYYDERCCVFSKDDLLKIKIRARRTGSECTPKPTNDFAEVNDLPEEALACDVTPKVTRYDDKYYVSCCYWSRFAGLIRELVDIKIENNKVTEFLDVNHERLYKYHCGIMY